MLLWSAGKKFSVDESLYAPRSSADAHCVATLHFIFLRIVHFPRITTPVCFMLFFFPFSCYVTGWLNGGNTSRCVIHRRLKAFVASNQGEGDCQPWSKEMLETLQDVGAPRLTGSSFWVGLFYSTSASLWPPKTSRFFPAATGETLPIISGCRFKGIISAKTLMAVYCSLIKPGGKPWLLANCYRDTNFLLRLLLLYNWALLLQAARLLQKSGCKHN